MQFRIADTFTDSLARLSGEEQKAVKTAAFDLQLNPSSPGLSFHRLERVRDKGFWSVRASSDIRLIVHRTESSLLLCYAGHHDNAYNWAERRKLETHPATGAAQLVELRERVEEILVPRYVEVEAPTAPKPALFAAVSQEQLLCYGVPVEWLDEVRQATEDTLLTLADHLPQEAAEALLELATGGSPEVPQAAPSVGAFEHPDAQRRFRVITNVEELERALESPWDKWTVFLHPAQRESVERDYSGPARISGSAGTGKTIVALHRAVHLARSHPDARVLLTTFSEPLANALKSRLFRLAGNEPRVGERIEVYSVDAVARRLYERNFGRPRIAQRDLTRRLIEQAAAEVADLRFSAQFLASEWEDVVDAWQLASWDAYRGIARLGRKTRLSEKHRGLLWGLFDSVRKSLQAEGLITTSELYTRLADRLREGQHSPYEFAVVDEAQDVSVPQLRFLAALGGDRPNGLFFAGDLGQRIFQQPFSWKALGVDIRGRSRTLRINYRTSHQIRGCADRLLGPEVTDVDGNIENRRGTISVFNGPSPQVLSVRTIEDETEAVSSWLRSRSSDGFRPDEIGVFVRSEAELERARSAVDGSGLRHKTLDDAVATTGGHVAVGTMHLAKGLEFRAVAVMACDDEVLPQQARIEAVADEADLEEVYNTERHLFYVACTRARDHLLVTGVSPVSEFLDDLVRTGPPHSISPL